MRFSLNIDSSNVALTDDDGNEEVARLLEVAAQQVRDGNTSGYLRDYNGNSVGHWEQS